MIWIIDDDDIFKFVISFQIEHLTGRTDLKMFNDITDALQQLKNSNQLPSVIMMDINFPNLNGWDFLHEFIATLTEKKAVTSIYMVSSSISKTDKEMLTKNQYVKALLEKPIEDSLVEQIMKKTISGQ